MAEVVTLGNWQPIWNAQVSILTPVCVSVYFNCALALAIYKFVGLFLMLKDRETYINP